MYYMYRMTWLKKRLKELGLARKGAAVQCSAVPDVQVAIKVPPCSITTCMFKFYHPLPLPQRELQGCHSNIGYRQMWRILQTKYNLVEKR